MILYGFPRVLSVAPGEGFGPVDATVQPAATGRASATPHRCCPAAGRHRATESRRASAGAGRWGAGGGGGAGVSFEPTTEHQPPPSVCLKLANRKPLCTCVK